MRPGTADKRSARPAKRKRESGLGYFILGSAVFLGSLALVLFGRIEPTWPVFTALAAGITLGIWLFRFGSRHAWVSMLCLFGSLAMCLILGINVNSAAGIAWMGGFVAGTNLGTGWRLAIGSSKPTAAWTVNGHGFSTAAEARNAAASALISLDGRARAHLAVEHRAARFEVAGSAASGLVCHRNPKAGQVGSWAVLVRPGQVADESVDVPMGPVTGFIPSRFVNDLGPVEAALADFLGNPGSAPSGQEWMTGENAMDMRLGS
ncbi:hypothetical protein [Arthrobacter sp. FW305-BF8]|uniref:hypothetical protein n=1 Tax=Arthrobacter sp. FW305-BF8 TaxID=2879617 RepID=UPI003FA4566D